jgi:hypothetical protein
MTTQEDPLAFNQDAHIKAETARLVASYGVRSIVETGTYLGHTTRYLASLGVEVHSIDISEDRVAAARSNLVGIANLKLWAGSSPEVLARIAAELPRPSFFYLDAHRCGECPLLDELTVIAESGFSDSIIAIHDFLVPGRDFGFNAYEGFRLDFPYVRGHLARVYGGENRYRHYYNKVASGAYRGIIYCVPCDGVEQR